MDVEKSVTVEFGIAKIMDAIGTDETVNAAIITKIIRIMASVMMIDVETAGMTAGVITIDAMEMETDVADIGDMPTIWVRSAAALIFLAAHPATAGTV